MNIRLQILVFGFLFALIVFLALEIKELKQEQKNHEFWIKESFIER